jgi:hypothetical protein
MMEDKKIVESRLGKVVRMSDRSNINWQLSKIPAELHPAVSRIALNFANTLGWECSPDFNFINSEDLRALRFVRLALGAIIELEEFCKDEWGTSLEELIDRETVND